MSALELRLELLWRGIHLEVVGAKVRYEAPPGALDRELREVGRQHMAEMVDLLSVFRPPIHALCEFLEAANCLHFRGEP